jgi:hypothetical protein
MSTGDSIVFVMTKSDFRSIPPSNQAGVAGLMTPDGRVNECIDATYSLHHIAKYTSEHGKLPSSR